jgi:hypothetical protein
MADAIGRPESSKRNSLYISKPNLSQHITVLTVAGLIRRQRQGKQVNLSLAMPEVKRACELIGTMLHTQIRNGRTLLESGGRPYKQPPQRREMPLRATPAGQALRV